MKDIEIAYNKLKKKYKLPDLKYLEIEFQIEIKKPELILQNIIDDILDILSDNSKLLESLIFVDSGSPASHLYEASMLNNHKIDAFDLYKKLMSLYWLGKKSKMKIDEKQLAKFINLIFNEWTKKIKPELIEMFETFEKEWINAKLRESEGFAYHG